MNLDELIKEAGKREKAIESVLRDAKCSPRIKKENMKADDLYFVRGDEEEEENGFYLVTKEFWEANHHVDDGEFGREIWDVLPKEFQQEMESYFQYYEYYENEYNPNPEKGLEILQSLGIQEVFMPSDH